MRAAKGISQERLAADTGIDRAYVSEIERELGNATIDVLDRLAVELEVDIGDFFAKPAAGAKRPKPLPKGRRPTGR
ncbi:MAG: helix-turn-helix transcriptional regulator [Alphaproteobacteria bacterium]